MTFSKDEIYTATQVVRNFSEVLSKVSTGENNRAFIVKNNKFEAVMLSMSEYERLNKAEELLKKIYEQRKKEEI
ncbi:MAG: type II toxin-antitoxin system prevent-host-death family antitoxin [Campylobacter sp.]|uniref:type II toxin-antitoxin system prevent-host-death family antitoxin n=1 Tax=Campylobacter sp. TaxID=205 RepID=UPI002977DED4|nr:type II toxin-antitoxin system prevent-host-death family antitoxin [Campylobacter sp.]MDD6162500.1 type II toxin-antitoxin system prevent-host-death family antitoxin [Campylobacteraceae bacterium]MDY2817407.1 type II toxin-antitoxin system prevent-host-death family antitoxin [Campylobacter lanienae]MCI6178390.1 type II toxin-antitoxin system Phd/YefM family antitoxin [Campylobacter sp.]MCI6298499.1 type II toxin-antitoxin system Phd/YefM family antitoxin [Campylobacter sp.]MCI6564004.1 type